MKFQIDHDLHVHSHLSSCSSDPEQTTSAILAYAERNEFKTVAVTDHYWDGSVPGASFWYQPQDFEHIAASLPLPQNKSVEFLFGCETDLDKNLTLGVPASRFDDFDFMIVPTTHLHMKGFTISEEDGASDERRAKLWAERFEFVLNQNLPFEKVGIAHLACELIKINDHLRVFDLIPSEEMERLFAKAALCGVGIELNASDFTFAESDTDRSLRMFRIAKSCGCKFYLGSDAHHPKELESAPALFERAVNLLDLTESDKIPLPHGVRLR